jgi:hypothetical protein
MCMAQTATQRRDAAGASSCKLLTWQKFTSLTASNRRRTRLTNNSSSTFQSK